MKKLILTLTLVAGTLTGAFPQGTINPLNGALTRVRFDVNGNVQYDVNDRAARPSDNVQFEIYWGAQGEIPSHLAGTMTIGQSDGIMAGLPPVFALPGAGDAGTVVSLRIRPQIGTITVGCTEVIEVTLGAADGPGAVIWGSTATGQRFSPLLLSSGERPCLVPEPSTLALGALGAAALFFLRTRKSSARR